MSYPQVKMGKTVKRADGVMMQEVITTTKEGSQLVTKTTYQPVNQTQTTTTKTTKPVDDELIDLEALLDESPGLSPEGRQTRATNAAPRATTVSPRGRNPTQASTSPRQEPQPKAAPVALTGEDTTMARLAQLKQSFTNGDLSKEEYDARRKQVLDEMMNGGGPKAAVSPPPTSSPRSANPSRLVGREVGKDVPADENEVESDSDEQQYIQDYHRDVYKNGREGEAMDKNATMMMNPSGVDGIYYTGKAPVVVDTVEEQLPDRKEGPEHKFRVIKTTMKKELLDTGVVRVTRTEKAYDGYTGAYLTMTVQQKMKPKLYFHSTEAWDDDKDFDFTPGSSKVAPDNVAVWHENFQKEEDEEYNRVMQQGVAGTEYKTRNVNNAAGKNDFGWDGVHRFPGGKPEGPAKKQSKFRNIFSKKGPPKKDPNDPWSGFQDDWGDDDDPMKQRVVDGSKPEYKDGGKKGIFNVKKAGPKRDKNMGENPADYKMQNPVKKEGDREYLWDDGRGAGGFASGEQWGANAKQHEGKHYAGGPHFTHQDMWK